MDDDHVIRDIISRFTHEIATEVSFKYLRPHLLTFIPRLTLERAEGRDRCNSDIMMKLCDSLHGLSKGQFEKFVEALNKDYSHISDKIKREFHQRTGRHLCSKQEEAQFKSVVVSQQSVQPASPPENQLAPNSSRTGLNTRQRVSSTVPMKMIESNQSRNNSEQMLVSTAGFNQLMTSISVEGASNARSASAVYEATQGVSKLPTNEHAALTRPSDTKESIERQPHLEYTSLGPAIPCPSDQAPQSSSSNPLANSGLSLSSQGAAYESKYAQMRERDPSEVYAMDTTPKGVCIIINNEKFLHLSSRVGSSEDHQNLTKMFEHLNFRVKAYVDKTANEMLTIFKDFARGTDLKDVAALAVVILSHGGRNDSIFGTDGKIEGGSPTPGTFIKKVHLQQIFNGRNCPAMTGKPKLFVLQACRGDEEDKREARQTGAGNTEGTLHRDSSDEGLTTSDDFGQAEFNIAETADMCFLHSASPGYRAYRSRTRGSPFIEELTKAVKELAHERSFAEIITMLLRQFSEKMIGPDRMTMPSYETTLTRNWYFNPAVRRD